MKAYNDGVDHARALGETVWAIDNNQPDWLEHVSGSLIFDLPDGPSPDELVAATKKALWTIVIDDKSNKLPWANVVLNSSILADSSAYPEDAKLLTGTEYLILDECFETASLQTSNRNDHWKVLITFGGSDPTGLTLNVLRTLGKSSYPQCFFTPVFGPGFREDEEINRAVASFPSPIHVLRNPPDLFPIFIDHHMIICAGGRTLYEANALRLPAIGIASSSHEVPVIQAFLQKGLILGGLASWDLNDFLRLFESVIKTHFRRER